VLAANRDLPFCLPKIPSEYSALGYCLPAPRAIESVPKNATPEVYQMQAETTPWWAALTVWGVVNAVNVLQAIGFLSRVPSGSTDVNKLPGYVS